MKKASWLKMRWDDVVVFLMCSLALVVPILGACQNNEGASDAGQTSAVPVMSTITSIPGKTASQSASSNDDTSDENLEVGDPQARSNSSTDLGLTGACAVRPYDPEIMDNMYTLPENPNGWEATDDTNYNPCTDLSYALIRQRDINGLRYRTQLMLFHQGEYLGIGSDRIQHADILSATEDSVTVRMQDWEALEAAGASDYKASSYYSDVTFR